MDGDLFRLLLLLLFTGLVVSAATPAAAVPHRRGYRTRTTRSSNSRDALLPSPPLPLTEETPTERSGSAVLVIPGTEAESTRRRRSRRTRGRRGGGGRARGRRGGRRRCGGVSRRVCDMGGDGSGLCLISLNIRSIKPKILSLRHDLSFYDCDICVLAETWLKPETLSRYVNFPEYSFIRADRMDGRGYGGVGVLARSQLSVKRLQSVCCSNQCKLETLWLSITNQRGRHFNLCALYRPPCHSSAQLSTDLACLESQLQRIMITSSAPIFIAGDINCNLLAPDTDRSKVRFMELLDSLSLHQFVHVPTHGGGSLLDVCISNRADFVTDLNVFKCTYSDHFLIKVQVNIPKYRAKPSYIMSRRLHRMNVLAFQTSLYYTDWSPVFSRVGVADQWSAFLDLFLPILDLHAPLKRIKIHNPSAPPVSDTTLRLMAQRRGLLARGARTPALLALDKRVKSAIRRDVRQDIARRVGEQGPATIFRNINQVITGKKSTMRVVPGLSPDELNEFFVGVGPRIAGEVRARGVPLDLPCRLPRVGACAFSLEPMTIDSLRPILFSMKNSGACGADGICIKIIKLSFDVIGQVILHILNTCLTSCQYPASWKHSIVHPIHKSGNPSDASNFRPISIVPAFPKLVERVVQRQLYSYMSNNNLFSSSQHGFRSRLSTETALLTVSDHILAATDRQELTLLCLLDLSKCFDVIDHSKLLSKLQAYSIDPTWFSSYLCGHTQSVCTADVHGTRCLSKPLPNPIGIFQGSCLGPLLFQIFANDLPLFTPGAHVVQYADDTQLLISGKKDSLPQLIATMEQTLESLDVWFHSHGLKVNTNKTELLLCGSRQNCRNLAPITVRFREDVVRESPTVRNLGVVFDKHLTWDSHVSALVKKCNGILIGLSHVRHQIPPELLPTVVNALVLSHVRYCLAVYGNGSENNIQRLQKVQNFALRVVSGRRKFDHISDVREDLGWPTARQLYRQHSLSMLHKIIITGEPQALASQVQTSSSLRSRSTRQDTDLALPRVRTESGKRRLLYSIVQLYNSLPLELRSLSLASFKHHLSSHL